MKENMVAVAGLGKMRGSMAKAFWAIVLVAVTAVSAARADGPLKSGERLVFLGDSISEQKIHTRYVMNYFTLRYPGLQVSFTNAGVGGCSSLGGLARLHRDVLSQKPSVVTICYGMNDGRYVNFDAGRFDNFMRGMAGLVAELKKANVRVVLLGPGSVDPERREMLKGVDYNDTLSRYSKAVKELAAKEKVEFIGLHDLMVEVQAKAKAKDPKYTLIPDGIHPGEPGQAVMAYAILKALGCKEQASGLEIDAAGAKAIADRCKVEDLKVAEDSITFTRTDAALPTYVDPEATSVFEFCPFVQELNQYNFKVTGLKAGAWKLSVEGIRVGTFSEKELAAGVNLATLDGPWKKLGQKIDALSREQEKLYFFSWRQFCFSTVQLAVPESIKPELDALAAKARTLAEEAEAARLKGVPKDRAWKWSLALESK